MPMRVCQSHASSSAIPLWGMREEPDELLSIYAGPDCSLPMQAEMMALWREAAPLFVEKIAAFGLAAVNVDETQCSVTSDSLLVTLTPLDDPEGSGQYGMGVHISTTVNFSTNGEPDPTDVNALQRTTRGREPARQPGPCLGVCV